METYNVSYGCCTPFGGKKSCDTSFRLFPKTLSSKPAVLSSIGGEGNYRITSVFSSCFYLKSLKWFRAPQGIKKPSCWCLQREKLSLPCVVLRASFLFRLRTSLRLLSSPHPGWSFKKPTNQKTQPHNPPKPRVKVCARCSRCPWVQIKWKPRSLVCARLPHTQAVRLLKDWIVSSVSGIRSKLLKHVRVFLMRNPWNPVLLGVFEDCSLGDRKGGTNHSSSPQLRSVASRGKRAGSSCYCSYMDRTR